MKTILKTTFIIAILAACSPKMVKKADNSTPNQDDANRAAMKWEGTTLEHLKQGKTLYETKCGTCHALPALTSKDEAGWNKIVPPMAKKARMDLSAETYVLKYVVIMSTRK